MPVSYTSAQANGIGGPFKFPEEFREACAANVSEAGCRPWRENIHWGGGGKSTQRFENLWDEPYVFAVVVDAKGYWIYRWRPNAYDSDGGVKTGWPGVERFAAERTLLFISWPGIYFCLCLPLDLVLQWPLITGV